MKQGTPYNFNKMQHENKGVFSLASNETVSPQDDLTPTFFALIRRAFQLLQSTVARLDAGLRVEWVHVQNAVLQFLRFVAFWPVHCHPCYSFGVDSTPDHVIAHAGRDAGDDVGHEKRAGMKRKAHQGR